MSAVIRRALLSVSDKRGLAEFAAGLHRHGIELLATGGTARLLLDEALEEAQRMPDATARQLLGAQAETVAAQDLVRQLAGGAGATCLCGWLLKERRFRTALD